MYDNWEELEKSIINCKKCKLCQNRTNIVFGTGNKEADLMFIGEGPGADEDKQGLPFVGKAGKLMNMAFEGIGINRKELYIANVVDYVSNFIKVISKNYIEIDKLEKFIIPNFKDDETKFVMNIIINKGIIDIIKNLFAKKQKNGEVKYAN